MLPTPLDRKLHVGVDLLQELKAGDACKKLQIEGLRQERPCGSGEVLSNVRLDLAFRAACRVQLLKQGLGRRCPVIVLVEGLDDARRRERDMPLALT